MADKEKPKTETESSPRVAVSPAAAPAIDPARVKLLAELWQVSEAEAEARELERLAKKRKAAV